MNSTPEPEWRQRIECAALVALVCLFLSITPVDDFDIGFVVATGRAILAGGIPAGEPFVPALAGEPLTSLWLMAAPLFAIMWDVFGPNGIIALKALCVSGGFLCLLTALSRTGVRPHGAATACVVAAVAVAARFTERPGLISILGFGLVALLASSARLRASPASPSLLLPLALGSTAWAWCHAEWQLGVAALVACSLDWREARASSRLLLTAAVTLVPVATFALLHPSGVAPLLAPWKLLLGLGASIPIAEYQAAAWRLMPMALMIPPVALWAAWRGWQSGRRGEALFVAALALLCAKTPRAVLPLAMLGLPLITSALRELGERVTILHSNRFLRALSIATTFLLVPLFVLGALKEPRGIGSATTLQTGAVAAVMVQVDEREGPLLCTFGWASALLLQPEVVRQGVVMDGRQEVYTSAYYENAYLRCMTPGPGWEEVISANGIAFYFEPYTMVIPAPKLMADFHRIGFKLVTWDGNGRLMARGDVVERWGLPVLEFDPGSIGPIIAQGRATMERAAAEFGTHSAALEVDQNPSAAGRIAQARLLLQLGRAGEAATALDKIKDAGVGQLLPYWQARAEVSIASNDKPGLQSACARLRRLEAGDLALLYSARWELSAGRQDNALALLKEAIEVAPDSRKPQIDAELGAVLAGQGVR